MTAKLLVLHLWKRLQVLEKRFFWRKMLPAYLCIQNLQNYVRKIFIKNWFWDIFTLGDFTVPKFALHDKVTYKTRAIKNPKNSAHCFEDNGLTNHLVKLLQDRINPFVLSAPFLYPLKAFWCFQGVEKRCIGNE